MSKNNNYHNKRGNSQKQKETNKRSAIMRFVDCTSEKAAQADSSLQGDVGADMRFAYRCFDGHGGSAAHVWKLRQPCI